MSRSEDEVVRDPPQRAERGQAVCLLDGPYVVDDGLRLPVPEGSERLLVFVVLANGRAVSRRKIAGTLWPSVTDGRAAGNLRTALWRLRSSGIRILDADHHALSVRLGTSVDVLTVDEWASRLVEGTADEDDLSIRHFHPAATELLPGWYDDWLVFERERIRQRMLHALEVLSRLLAREGRFGEAVEAAMTAIEIDPLRESAQRSLILIHLSEGNIAEAQRAYAAYTRLLDSELGIAPTPEIARLMHLWCEERQPGVLPREALAVGERVRAGGYWIS